MSDTQQTESAALKRALLAIKDLRAKLEMHERARREPIAIVGVGCRFPGGVTDLESFWRLLRDGGDAVTEVPRDRWDAAALYDADPEAPGKTYSRHGGFLDAVDRFDASFFGISPREAVGIDPQQRLLLEVAWEALEHAGQDFVRLPGSDTGVFVGISTNEYGQMQTRAGGSASFDAYSGTGNTNSVAAGRIAYVLGLHGPTMSVDTACSSSLVVVQLACQALRNRQCRMALAGGVNLVLSPDATICMSKVRALSVQGRCRTFDASADGYVRGEGCGILVLKRLSDAEAEGDNVLAVIRGAAVNHDGRSGGLTVPNGLAQQAVIRAALEDGGVDPLDVSYAEAHGTGTALGDPIEVRALAAVLCAGRDRAQSLALGSVKTNLGHLESAAGVSGLIKVVLALMHRELPPHLHLQQLSPHVDWSSMPITIPTTRSSWNPSGRRRVAGINSFGLSGTNAHVILEETPSLAAPQPQEEQAPAHLLTISGRSARAVQAIASRLDEFLATSTDSLADVCFTANAGRAQFAHRAAIVARDASEARTRLRALSAAGDAGSAGIREWSGLTRPKVAFLFTGQGSQYIGMGRALYETQPVFRAATDRCSSVLSPLFGRDLVGVMFGSEDGAEALLNQTGWTQPALFAIEYALAELWRSWGLEPHAVLGHSVGEYAAACVAGVFSLEDGLRLIATRARLMQSLPAGGKMTAIFADEQTVRRAITQEREVSMAAVNGPASVVISGAGPRVDAIAEALGREGVSSKALNVSHAFHSPLMSPMLGEFDAAARTVRYSTPSCAVISNVTGSALDAFDASYWRRHIEAPVQFAAGVHSLREKGCSIFVEIGPSPVLIAMAARALGDDKVASVPSLRPGRADWQQMLESAGELFLSGISLDWAALAGGARRKVPLPTYPFERQRFWFDFGSGGEGTATLLAPDAVHPLLGSRFESPVLDRTVFQADMTPASVPSVRDHVVQGLCVFPGAGYLEVMQEAARLVSNAACELSDVVFEEPLILDDERTRRVQTIVTPLSASASGEIVVVSAEAGAEHASWTSHARGSFAVANAQSSGENVEALRARCTEVRDVDSLYRELHERGLEYGPGYRCVTGLWSGNGEALGRVELPESARGSAGRFALHPALLDAALQVLGGAMRSAEQSMFLPVGVGRALYRSTGASAAWAHVQLRSSESRDAIVADVAVYDGQGALILRLERFTAKRVDPGVLARLGAARLDEWMYRIDWHEAGAAEGAGEAMTQWVVFGRDPHAVEPLVSRLSREGACTFVSVAAEYSSPAAGRASVRIDSPDDVRQVVREAVAPGRAFGVIFAAHSTARLDGDLPDEEATRWLLHVVQAITAEQETRARLWVVTHGAQDVLGAIGAAAVSQAPLLGLARVAANEHPEIRCVRVDLDPHGTSYDWQLVVDALCMEEDEPEFAVRTGRRWVPRMMPATHAADRRGLLAVPADAPFKVGVSSRGVIDNITTLPLDRREPLDGEIEVEIDATGLNFRDVLNVLGMYPGDPGALGGEFAGRVARTGPGVTQFAPGDGVFGIAGGTFASHVVTRSDMVVRRPSWMTVAEAASMPIAYLTAYYGLHQLARIKSGDRVLVHAAAGGVGIAAVQLAQRAGAQVFGTAGSVEKRKYVQSLGVEHVYRSRTADFRTELMAATAGAGVDIVLNALTGEFIPESLKALSPGGTFLEIGKAEIWSEKQVAAVSPRAKYLPYDLVDVVSRQPALIGAMLRELVSALEDGSLKLMPLRTFDLTETPAAFRYMAQAKHIGKIALVRKRAAGGDVLKDASYLVTGGLGGLGLRLVGLLADRGAGSVFVVGRSAPSPEAEEQIRLLRGRGTAVSVVRADISVETDVRRVFETIDAGPRRLRGIIHAAGVLDDAMLKDQTAERLHAVLSPKAIGAALLDRLARGRHLDFFVSLSSIASVFGAPGQGPYAAANAALDALAARRRALGLSGQSLNWGPWDEVGMAARLGAARRERVTQQGFALIPVERGLAAFLRAMSLPHAQLAIANIDWGRVLQSGAMPPLLRDIAHLASGRRSRAAETAAAVRLTDRLSGIPPAEWSDEILRFTRQQVSKVLAITDADSIGEHVPLTDLGMDSLMAVELRNALGGAIARALPASLVFDYPTVRALAEYLHTLAAPVEPLGQRPTVTETAVPAPQPVEQLGTMSQDEIALLLAERLATLKDLS